MGQILRSGRAFLIAGLLAFAAANSASAQEKKDREYRFGGTQIEGEREKPKDLYILPWQGSAPIEDSKLRLELLGGFEELKDRYQLEREIEYYQRVGEKTD